MDMQEKFLKRIDVWAEEECDKRLEKALDVYEDWCKGLNEQQEQQFTSFLERFNYYTDSKVNNILSELHKIAVENYNISNKNTVVSVVRKNQGAMGSSSAYWLKYKYASGLSSKVFYDSLEDIEEESWNNIMNVVFIDDCCGTGKTFINFIDKQNKDFSNKQIILITIEMMQNAKKCIEEYAKKKQLNIALLHYNCAEKVSA